MTSSQTLHPSTTTTATAATHSHHDKSAGLSFSPSAWELLQSEIKTAEYNRKNEYTNKNKPRNVGSSSRKKREEVVLIATQRENLHLPSHHPNNNNHQKNDVVPIRLTPPTGRPISNYQKLVRKCVNNDNHVKSKVYEGAYTETYASQVEAEILEYNKSKQKFVGGVYSQIIYILNLNNYIYFFKFKKILLILKFEYNSRLKHLLGRRHKYLYARQSPCSMGPIYLITTLRSNLVYDFLSEKRTKLRDWVVRGTRLQPPLPHHQDHSINIKRCYSYKIIFFYEINKISRILFTLHFISLLKTNFSRYLNSQI